MFCYIQRIDISFKFGIIIVNLILIQAMMGQDRNSAFSESRRLVKDDKSISVRITSEPCAETDCVSCRPQRMPTVTGDDHSNHYGVGISGCRNKILDQLEWYRGLAFVSIKDDGYFCLYLYLYYNGERKGALCK